MPSLDLYSRSMPSPPIDLQTPATAEFLVRALAMQGIHYVSHVLVQSTGLVHQKRIEISEVPP